MPYIEQKNRPSIDVQVDKLSEIIADEGQLNYAIFSLCKRKVQDWKLSYNTLNRIVGVFECCKAEFIRRIVSPYEDLKINQNGDVGENRDTNNWRIVNRELVYALKYLVEENNFFNCYPHPTHPFKEIIATISCSNGKEIVISNPERLPIKNERFYFVEKEKGYGLNRIRTISIDWLN